MTCSCVNRKPLHSGEHCLNWTPQRVIRRLAVQSVSYDISRQLLALGSVSICVQKQGRLQECTHTPLSLVGHWPLAVNKLWWARSRGHAAVGQEQVAALLPHTRPGANHLPPLPSPLELFCWLGREERVNKGSSASWWPFSALWPASIPEEMRYEGKRTRVGAVLVVVTAANAHLCGSVRWGERRKAVCEVPSENIEGCTFLCSVCWGSDVC